MTTLKAFEPEQIKVLHRLLAIKVAYMMGRKMEENDWGDAYCKAKGVPPQKWSNLNIDFVHENLGVEHKMLCVRSKGNIVEQCGKSLMHPSATRSIRIATTDADANDVMKDVFEQYAALIEARRAYVKEKTGTDKPVELRTGWLLWQESLHQFLYFEEEMFIPKAENYSAVWEEGQVKGNRKSSKNLWIYEKSTGKKRYSVTTSAGIKIQPYFDVPPPTDPNIYLFTVTGETINTGDVQIWLTESTLKDAKKHFGTIEKSALSDKLIKACANISSADAAPKLYEQNGESLVITSDAYLKLYETFPEAISDEHAFLMLVDNLT